MDPTTVQGGLIQTLKDLYGIEPVRVEFDLITMMGVIGAATLTNPDPVTLQIGYDHIIYGISAFISNATDNIPNFTRAEFNITNSRESKLLFQNPVNLGAFLSTTGAGDVRYLLPAFKKFPERTTLTLSWSRSQFDNAWAGADKNVGVCLHGLKILHGNS